jgi:glycosyltransferase involved in cell wall biosynthesis
MSKILIVTLNKNHDNNVVGGVEQWADQLKNALEYGDHTVFHWCIRDALESFTKREGKPPLFSPDAPKHEYVWFMNREFSEHRDYTPYNYIIFNSDEAYNFAPPKSCKAKIIGVFHGTYKGCGEKTNNVSFQSVHWSIQKSTIPLFSKIVCVSENTKTEVGIKDAVVIPNGVDTDKFEVINKAECRKKLAIRDDVIVPLYIGHRAPSKGWDVWSKIFNEHHGEGIHFFAPPNVPHDMLPIVYGAADYLIFPSQYEACPYTVLEALSCNLPVMSTPVGFFDGIADGFNEWGMIKTDYSKFNPCWHLEKGIKPRDWLIKNKYDFKHFRTNWLKLIQDMSKEA